MSDQNRYAKDWDAYSRTWDDQYGKAHRHLGDEWNDDGTQERLRDNFYFHAYADRWLRPDMTVLEVGPGGGKWTVRIAPLVKRLVVLDVSQEMLNRTKARCDAADIRNVDFVLGNGTNFLPIADETVDFFFSFDVFVHIALEDAFAYAQEMMRVLVPDGVGICHQAICSVPSSWNRIEQNNDWFRGGKNSLGQYYYHSPESLRRLYEHCGLDVMEQHQEEWNCTSIFRKRRDSIVPELEGLLRMLAGEGSNDLGKRNELLQKIESLPARLSELMAPLLESARSEEDYYRRIRIATQLRRIWRGSFAP